MHVVGANGIPLLHGLCIYFPSWNAMHYIVSVTDPLGVAWIRAKPRYHGESTFLRQVSDMCSVLRSWHFILYGHGNLRL